IVGRMGFTGFPAAALDFYDDLEMDNSKTYWTANKHVYEESVLAPMTALLAELEEEFGTAKMFRPYRDVRFAKDKSPYKTHQGARLRRRPSPHRAAPAQVPDGRQVLRLRAGHPHAGTGRAGPRRLAGHQAADHLADRQHLTQRRRRAGDQARS